MSGPLIYLACPYSSPDRAVRVARFEVANRAAARLMGGGLLVFSPLSHGWPIAQAGELPTDWAFWEAFTRAVLAACSEVRVLMLPGWRESVGVQAEIRIAGEMGLAVSYTEAE